MLARSLIDGQREIDRMKKEVEQVVKMCVGFFHNWYKPMEDEAIAFNCDEEDLCKFGKFNEWTWTIEREKGLLLIRCRHDVLGVRYRCGEEGLPFLHGSHFTHFSSVKDVYSGLDAFAEAMAKRVPWLPEVWASIVKAAPPVA
jgi:hypothetical protein